LKADDAWQCLATCIEIRNALESPDPERYVSCLPVHQDGTCNGLQHYAALGGDVIGARQVNLDVSDRPADVYTYVSDMAKAQVNKDAAEGHELAQQLVGKINRKLVKQTVCIAPRVV
jgi:DNA-directed RNA polymerase